MEYPEIEKMKAVKAKSQAIGEFLENSGKYSLCELLPNEWDRKEWVPVHKSIEDILAEYFHIDLKKVETEKRQILDTIRNQDKKNVQKA